MTTVLSVMAHNGRLPFPISSPACNRADATSVDRISSFCRSRTGFLRSPDFHISPRSQSCCSPPLRPLPLPCSTGPSVSLSLPAATTVTGDYGEKPRGETEITDVLPACGVEIDRGVASLADGGGGRDEERKMSGTREEIDRGIEGEATQSGGWSEGRASLGSDSTQLPILLYCLVMQILRRRRDKAVPSVVLRTCLSLSSRIRTHARGHARTQSFVMRVISGARRARRREGRNEENERTFRRKQ